MLKILGLIIEILLWGSTEVNAQPSPEWPPLEPEGPAEGDACVYTLTIQFSDSSSIDRPDVDLCQTETLMVE